MRVRDLPEHVRQLQYPPDYKTAVADFQKTVAAKLKELEGCEIYSIEQEKGVYTVSIDTEDHTFMIKVSGSADVKEWDRFLRKD